MESNEQVEGYMRDVDNENETGEIDFSDFLSIMSFKMKDLDT